MLTHWLGDDFKGTWNKMLHTLEQNGHSEVVTSIKKHDTIKGLQTASYCMHQVEDNFLCQCIKDDTIIL